jgi:carboxyl-terminal processing protease
MIKPAIYDQSNHIEQLLGELDRRHQARVEGNVDFNYYRALAQKGKEAAQRTHLSLNEAERRKEKEVDDKWRLDLENGLRVAKGKPVAASLEELEDLEEVEQKATSEDDKADPGAEADEQADVATAPAEAPIEALEDDAMVEEAAKILLDLIGLSMQVAQVEATGEAAKLGSTAHLPPAQARNDG